MTVYRIAVQSISDIRIMYAIVIDTEKGSVDCSCKSGRIRGWCKHIRFYKDLIKDLMHKNHRLWRDKEGK